MFRLKLPTDPRWVELVENNIPEILTDHAYCEQKAASNAISIIVRFPEKSDLVTAMLEVAREELEHFQRVHQKILDRGLILGRERKDDYVNLLMEFMRKGVTREKQLVDRLLFAAMVEARSCERFKVLTEKISDPDLKGFYEELMVSEANHYALFLGFARQYAAGEDVDQRWQEWLDYEGQIIAGFGKKETMHG
ncbi:MAG: tRNA-(ms[2]io[6]A)-hydroxylase [Sphingobacteriales bacterium]|jgi:tRNA-(ms[2]io[6]A)-hydroxylase|nr:tRNA-(ms[2]io[6]A)-hydroxylase [Sphingobacteriales bacterium]